MGSNGSGTRGRKRTNTRLPKGAMGTVMYFMDIENWCDMHPGRDLQAPPGEIGEPRVTWTISELSKFVEGPPEKLYDPIFYEKGTE